MVVLGGTYSMAPCLIYSALFLVAVLVGGLVVISAQSNRPDAKAGIGHGDALLRKLDGKYTPQMVVNGEEQIVGSDPSGLLRAIRKEGQQSHVDIHIATASLSRSTLSIVFWVSGGFPGDGAEIYAILVEDAASSNVMRGKNSGRTLSHASVARTITRLASIQTATKSTIHFPLSASLQFSNHDGRHSSSLPRHPDSVPSLERTLHPCKARDVVAVFAGVCFRRRRNLSSHPHSNVQFPRKAELNHEAAPVAAVLRKMPSSPAADGAANIHVPRLRARLNQ